MYRQKSPAGLFILYIARTLQNCLRLPLFQEPQLLQNARQLPLFQEPKLLQNRRQLPLFQEPQLLQNARQLVKTADDALRVGDFSKAV